MLLPFEVPKASLKEVKLAERDTASPRSGGDDLDLVTEEFRTLQISE